MAGIEALKNVITAAAAKDSPDGELVNEAELKDAWATAQRPSVDGLPVRVQRNWLSAFLHAIADAFREMFSGGKAVTETFNSGDQRRDFGAALARAHASDIVAPGYRPALEAELKKQIVLAQRLAKEPVDEATAAAYAKDMADGFAAEATRLAAAGQLPRGPFVTADEANLLRDLDDSKLTAGARTFRKQVLASPGFPARTSGATPSPTSPATGVSLRPAATPRVSGPPQELLDLQEAQRNAYPAPTAADYADSHFRDKRGTGRHFKPAGSLKAETAAMAGKRDASNAMIVAENADLWVLRYSYTTDKPMEVWVQNGPADGKLKVSAIVTPSSHDGDVAYQNYARTNRYHVEVQYADGTTTKTDFGVKNPPEYASVSDPFVIDLSKKGDIIVSGWPEGSAGIYGYREARQLVIHNR